VSCQHEYIVPAEFSARIQERSTLPLLRSLLLAAFSPLHQWSNEISANLCGVCEMDAIFVFFVETG
jgi:hypothetical protein